VVTQALLVVTHTLPTPPSAASQMRVSTRPANGVLPSDNMKNGV
jgi:hypothetical protein